MNEKMHKTSVVIHLHTHMPFVMNHDMWPHGVDWLSEVVFESYLPILELIQHLQREDIRPSLSFDFSPVLLEQLSHSKAFSLFEAYAKRQIEQTEKDLHKFSVIPEACYNIPIGEFWNSFYKKQLRNLYELNNGSIIEEFRIAEQKGLIEHMSCGLTHAYLPLLSIEQSTYMQIAGSTLIHEQYFARKPKAIFLPECGYSPALQGSQREYYLEEIILAQSLHMIILDQQHSLKYLENPLPTVKNLEESLRPLSPVRLKNRFNDESLYVLIRHKTASDKVWSEMSGFPKHPSYLDFYKREYDSTLRYWKVTNHSEHLQEKLPYTRTEAIMQAQLDAKNYVKYLEQLAVSYKTQMNETGIICLAFDTELFGHWWFEGPEFLGEFIREIHRSEILELKLPSEIPLNDSLDIVHCSSGSWGMNGTDETWRNDETKWLLDKMHKAEQLFEHRMQSIDLHDQLQIRIMNQALKELLLMQASDWPFLITKNQASDYAKARFTEHHTCFSSLITLYDSVIVGNELTKEEFSLLDMIEHVDDIFQNIHIHQWMHHSS